MSLRTAQGQGQHHWITPRFRAESTGERITSFVRRIEGELSLESCCGRPLMRNSVLEGLRVRSRSLSCHAPVQRNSLPLDMRQQDKADTHIFPQHALLDLSQFYALKHSFSTRLTLLNLFLILPGAPLIIGLG